MVGMVALWTVEISLFSDEYIYFLVDGMVSGGFLLRKKRILD